jgi:hypothetical protein
MSAGPQRETPDAFPAAYLDELKLQVRKHPCFTVNNLNRDFVQTRGFSVVFRRDGMAQVVAAFPFFAPYLQRALRADCNAFYLNPLELEGGSRVDPHIDRSLRGYCKDVSTPPCIATSWCVGVTSQPNRTAFCASASASRAAVASPVTRACAANPTAAVASCHGFQ